MKTFLLKSLKTTGIVAVCSIIAACGGGGGGGGSEAPTSDNTQLEIAAPGSLSAGMTFTLRENGGETYTWDLISPTSFRSGAGNTANLEYTKTSANTCEISYRWAHALSTTYTYKFVFTAVNEGDYYNGATKRGTFTLSGNNAGSNNNVTNNGNNNVATTDYAPNEKSQIRSITFNGYEFSSTSVKFKHANMSGGYSYKKTGPNRAEIRASATKNGNVQAVATLIDGIPRIKNYNVVLQEADATFTLEFLNGSQVKVVGYDEIQYHSYTTHLLNLIGPTTRTSSNNYNTTASWK